VSGMGRAKSVEIRDEVELTNLDQPLFDGAEATKRDLVDYLDAVRDRILPALRDRPLSVIRVRPGQPPFMQKNLPKYAPDWMRTVSVWAEASKREVHYALCNDRRSLLWLANQRSVEYHPALMLAEQHHPTHLILDLDPPADDAFSHVVATARLVEQALADSGIATTAFIREDRGHRVFVDSTRAGGATVVAAYSPRARPGLPVSFPVRWDRLDEITPRDFTVHTAPALLADSDPWQEAMPAPQRLPEDLVAEGHAIPVARVQAMHEGKRRARARRE